MKKHFGLVSGTFALALVSAAALAQPAPPFDSGWPDRPLAQGRPAPPAPPAPALAVTAPVAVPAPPAPPAPSAPSVAMTAPAPAAPAPPAPVQVESPQKPTTPPAPPKPAAAPKAPEPPQAPEPMLLTPGRERIDPDPVNIRFEVTIAYQAGTAAPVKRTAVLTVANNTGGGPGFDRASLRSGNNIPVPSTTFTPVVKEGPATNPITSFSYRSVGLNVDVRNAALLPGNRVRATLNVEFSGVDEKTSATPAPSFPTFSQSISLYFDNGKPVLVAQSSDVVDSVERKQTVEVKATILR